MADATLVPARGFERWRRGEGERAGAGSGRVLIAPVRCVPARRNDSGAVRIGRARTARTPAREPLLMVTRPVAFAPYMWFEFVTEVGLWAPRIRMLGV
jgi:hypothetical protein